MESRLPHAVAFVQSIGCLAFLLAQPPAIEDEITALSSELKAGRMRAFGEA